MPRPPFMPSFGTLPGIDRAVQIARGVAPSILGETYDVYRLSAATSATGIVSVSSLIQSKVPAMFEKATSKRDVEVETIVKALIFTPKVNLNAFLAGDVFVQRLDSYRYNRGIFTLASVRQTPHEPVAISTPIYATITRPESNPQHITVGRVPQSVPIKGREWPLTLSAGYYSFQPTGTPVTVPIGMILGRTRDFPKTDAAGELWDDTRRMTWDCFLPLTPGQPIIPRDIITGGNGDRYEVVGVQTVTSSFFGQFISVNRIRS